VHYYTFHISNYRKRTAHLSLLEHGIYRALLDSYYLDESPVCADDAKVMRTHCIRTPEEKEAFRLVVDEFFTKEGETYRHSDCDEHLEKIYQKSEKARESAKARWSKNANASKKNANATPEDASAPESQCERNADGMLPNTQYPIPNTKDKKPLSTKADTVSQVFAYWCEAMSKNPNTAKLTPKRKKAIEGRLKDGYTLDQLKQAIDGCKADPFSMGANDRQKAFNDIELICRTGEKLESFLDQPVNSVPIGFNGPNGSGPSDGLSAITRKNLQNTAGEW